VTAYISTTTLPDEMLLAVDIPGAVRRILPKESWNCDQLGVVVDDGVDGVHGVGAENREIHKKKVASELLFFFDTNLVLGKVYAG
jgi:hypothetical protein